MAGLNQQPPQRWVICNTLGEGRDPRPGVMEWIRACERCGTALYVTPLYLAQGYRVSCWWCHPPQRPVSAHPHELDRRDAAGALEAYQALAEIREWLSQRADRQRHATIPLLGRFRRHLRRRSQHPGQ